MLRALRNVEPASTRAEVAPTNTDVKENNGPRQRTAVYAAQRDNCGPFNTRVAKHLFCAECGIKGFYRPRSNPDGWSVNARCLDSTDGFELVIEAFDGRNWETSMQQRVPWR